MVTTRARTTRRVRAGVAVLAGGSFAFGLLTDYEQIRANPLRFVIKPGHEIDAVERVISEDGGGYAVVEKHQAEGDLIEMDPRAAEAS